MSFLDLLGKFRINTTNNAHPTYKVMNQKLNYRVISDDKEVVDEDFDYFPDKEGSITLEHDYFRPSKNEMYNNYDDFRDLKEIATRNVDKNGNVKYECSKSTTLHYKDCAQFYKVFANAIKEKKDYFNQHKLN